MFRSSTGYFHRLRHMYSWLKYGQMYAQEILSDTREMHENNYERSAIFSRQLSWAGSYQMCIQPFIVITLLAPKSILNMYIKDDILRINERKTEDYCHKCLVWRNSAGLEVNFHLFSHSSIIFSNACIAFFWHKVNCKIREQNFDLSFCHYKNELIWLYLSLDLTGDLNEEREITHILAWVRDLQVLPRHQNPLLLQGNDSRRHLIRGDGWTENSGKQ